ncbi:M23 family metallopeptidase [Chitinophaga filiformis]|uniref:M23 family metallopeptidase n=1 Tax=Chitinophaga filiformis TaxID=104663 RepID=UPI001F16750B|nr:M23 family metallopeptidase [Chitinophaga filiformis]MCF6402555.1 M23 family metallopeptidase [Chitinophaga filiformis]MCF6403527.1 M23 family metallopeptidase [Chitinophaga filiformis]
MINRIAYNSPITGLFFIYCLLVCTACSSSKRGLFAKKTAHEQYASRITDAGLGTSTMGSLWFAAAEKALVRPLTVTLPYRETGYFAAEKPDAAGYLFTARRGDRLDVQITVKSSVRLQLFTELWQPAEGSEKPRLLATADTVTGSLQYEIERNGRFLLRLQPELLQSGEYTVSINTAPSLAFPVAGNMDHRIGSFWGDRRDKGARSHEGIDIFGKFRTPVVAAADGIVTSTRQTNLGGKVVFLSPNGKPYALYYAHLDSQLVREGQRVRTGDTLGLMGNTGNARTTPTHLHFGIYTNSGAVDPLPFVSRNRPEPATVQANTSLLRQTARSTTATPLYASPIKNSTSLEKLPANYIMYVMAATGNWYKVVLPDSREGFVESKSVSGQPYKRLLTKTSTRLFDAPDSIAAVKTTIPKGKDINVLGSNGIYQFVNYEELNGWIQVD